MIVPAGIVEGTVKTTVCPEIVTALGVTGVLPTNTVYWLVPADVELNGSLRVIVTWLPE